MLNMKEVSWLFECLTEGTLVIMDCGSTVLLPVDVVWESAVGGISCGAGLFGQQVRLMGDDMSEKKSKMGEVIGLTGVKFWKLELTVLSGNKCS